MAWLEACLESLQTTVFDVLPVLVVLVLFQTIILRQPIPNPRRTIVGFACVLVGLALFLVGLERALFPLGRIMAQQLTAPSFIGLEEGALQWWDYYWVYIFAAAIGFSTTIAEPSLPGTRHSTRCPASHRRIR